jgi:hypothetical protein
LKKPSGSDCASVPRFARRSPDAGPRRAFLKDKEIRYRSAQNRANLLAAGEPPEGRFSNGSWTGCKCLAQRLQRWSSSLGATGIATHRRCPTVVGNQLGDAPQTQDIERQVNGCKSFAVGSRQYFAGSMSQRVVQYRRHGHDSDADSFLRHLRRAAPQHVELTLSRDHRKHQRQ